MICPACGASLPESLFFCVMCGSSLGRKPLPNLARHPFKCLSCRHLNAPAARFCARCGTPRHNDDRLNAGDDPGLDREPSLHDRPVASVLHADLLGFTRLSEQLTPEQTKSLMDALFADFSRAVVEGGGRVDAFIGDAILAVFGFPITHGDDAVRAVRVATTLHQQMEAFSHPVLQQDMTPLRIRIGISTGPVVLGHIGLSRQTTITGAAVSEAMELERDAPPGGTLLSASTAALVSGRVPLEPTNRPRRAKAWIVLHSEGMPDALNTSMEGNTSNKSHKQVITALRTSKSIPPKASAADESPQARARARIESLEPAHQRLLRLSSIAGTYFWTDVLERIGLPDAGRSLAAMEAAGIIQVCPRPSISGTIEYRFNSDVLREVAYRQNLNRVREFVHKVIAAWLEERVSGSLEFVPLLAHHHVAGGDRAAAARVLMTAGRRLTAMHATGEAQARYREALTYLEDLEEGDPSVDEMRHRCRETLATLSAASSTVPMRRF